MAAPTRQFSTVSGVNRSFGAFLASSTDSTNANGDYLATAEDFFWQPQPESLVLLHSMRGLMEGIGRQSSGRPVRAEPPVGQRRPDPHHR